MPRFVILRHHTSPGFARPTHWDLMLEDGDHLLTWALSAPPLSNTDAKAEQLDNHRLAYLEFEGPVSGNRGHVQRIESGEFEWLVRDEDHMRIAMRGKEWQATLQLTRCADQSWRCSHADESR